MGARSAVALLAAAVVLLGSCDGSGPDDTIVQVTVTAEVFPAAIFQRDPDVIECEARLRATGRGPTEAVATWGSATLRWFAGPDRSTPMQVDTIPRHEVRAFWGGSELAGGSNTSAGWRVSAGMPFVLEAAFRYTTGRSAREHEAVVLIACGVDGGSALPGPPAVSDLAVSVPEPFQPGDSIEITFAASAPGRLWQTRVMIHGAFYGEWVRNEQLATHATRTLRLIAPAAVTLGQPIDIRVEAIDAYGRVSQPLTHRSATMVDERPPTFIVTTSTFGLPPGVGARLVGQYAVGDSVRLLVVGGDNYRLGELTVTLGAVSHRFPLNQQLIHGEEFFIPVRPEWIGAPGLAVTLTDHQGLQGPHYAAHPDSVRVHALNSYASSHVVVDGARVRDAVWDDLGERLYVVPEAASEVLVISTVNMTLAQPMALAAAAVSIDLTQDNRSLAVATTTGNVVVIDLPTGQAATFEFADAGIVELGTLRAMAGNQAIVAGRMSDGSRRVLVIDLERGLVRQSHPLTGAGGLNTVSIARTRDGNVAGVLSDGCLNVWLASSQHLAACIPFPGFNGQLTVDPMGRWFASRGNILDTSTGAGRLAGWGLAGTHLNSVFANGEASLFLASNDRIRRIRLSDGVVLESIPFHNVYGQMMHSADGSRLLTVSNDFDSHPHRFRVDRLLLR